MKSLIQAVAIAVVLAAPLASFAQPSAQPVSQDVQETPRRYSVAFLFGLAAARPAIPSMNALRAIRVDPCPRAPLGV
jgi:hypothetical protein